MPTPGSPPSRTSEAGHEPAAEHTVELRHAGADPRRLLDLDVDEPQRRPRAAAPPAAPAPGTTSSTSVPKEEQPGHFPNQRPAA